ncbi:MAG TPA: PrsW family glutamic-type intramembrane protease [Acidimicrobiales bacterium]|nr:PrsW family glutamic-type intramembrane protease [Acidimicrobiales bacterium]
MSVVDGGAAPPAPGQSVPPVAPGTITIHHGRHRFVLQPGQAAKVGSGPANEVVVSDPRVSATHLFVSWSPQGWVLDSVGTGGTYMSGQLVTRVLLTHPVEARLAAPDGPLVHFEPAVTAPSAGVPASTVQGALAKAGLGHHNGQWASTPELEELSTALKILVPIRSWLKNPSWHKGLRLCVIPYALLPLSFIALFAGSGNLTTPGWAYSLYVAPLWLVAFWYLIRPGTITRQEVVIGAIVIAWVLTWMKLVTIHINDHLAGAGQSLTFIKAIGVGFNEEITKALPVLILAVVLMKFRSTRLDVRMWMFIGTIAGLTFGVYEATSYTVGAIVSIHAATGNNGAVVASLEFAYRVFVDGFQHAVWAGISCFFVGMAINHRRRGVQLILVGIVIAAVLHGVNDWIAPAVNSLWAQVAVEAVSLFLFFGYSMSARDIELEVQQNPVFEEQPKANTQQSQPTPTT